MKRDTQHESKQGSGRAGIFISKQTLDTILRQKTRRADMIALLNFYHYTGLWQGTNQPYASLKFVARGLQWGPGKMRAVRSLLLKLRLIEDIRAVDSKTGKVTGWFVRLRYFHPTDLPEGGCYQRVDSETTNALRSVKGNALRSVKENTHSDVFSANGLTEEQKQIVAHFNETFVPHGFLPVEKITKATRAILERKDCTLQRFDELLNDQAAWPHKRTFYKLFHTRTAAERLASKSNKDLQSLRYKLLDKRNSGTLSRAEMEAAREQLLEIKQILKGRGIEYAASI